MRLLIDGYNLLYTVGIPGCGHGIPRLERSRLGLLKRLAAVLAPPQRRQTVVVFDARNAPPGVPRRTEYCGLNVCFAAGYADADSLLEELIEDHPAPQTLTVVSSDRRVQRAARRRKARAVDSESWYARQVAAGQPAAGATPDRTGRPQAAPKTSRDREGTPDRGAPPILPDDVLAWLDDFGGIEAIEAIEAEEGAANDGGAAPADARAPRRPAASSPTPDDGTKDGVPPFDNPFPPGWAEDVDVD